MRMAWMAAWVLLAGVAPAQEGRAQPVLDPAAVPALDAAGRAAYSEWLLSGTPRAFAVGSNGKMGWYSGWYQGAKTVEEAGRRAVQLCTDHGGTDCRPYAEDLSIVWPGREWHPAAPPGPLVDTINYGFVPDQHFLWHGPAAARGVVVWAIGSQANVDLRGLQPPPYVRAFNDAGFDVIRFDRAPAVDTAIRAAGWLRDELPVLRRSGYRMVVVAGDSRGAWTSLQMLNTAGLADVVIAIVPAAQGSGASVNLSAQDDDLRALMVDAQPSRTRVAIAQFTGDTFMSDADTRAQLFQRLKAKEGALLVIDRPPGLNGHAGGISSTFSLRYGPCLLQFATAATPPSVCGDSE